MVVTGTLVEVFHMFLEKYHCPSKYKIYNVHILNINEHLSVREFIKSNKMCHGFSCQNM